MTKYALLIILLFVTQLSLSQSQLSQEDIHWLEFQWSNPKEKSAIFLKSRLDTLDYNFNWQLDTGSPYTFINGATWNIFNDRLNVLSSFLHRIDSAKMGDYYKVTSPPFTFYSRRFLPDTLLKNDKVGGGFPPEYVEKYRGYGFTIGTIGLDMFRNNVLILDFKNNKIGHADKLSAAFYSKKIQTSNFTFYKNRIIIPVTIGGKDFPFMYDCGASMFTLQTTPKNSINFAPPVYADTLFNINNGETGQVHNVAGGKIGKAVKILGKEYKDMIVYVEKGESDVFDEAKVNGIVGNQLFLDHTLIIDFRERKFSLVE